MIRKILSIVTLIKIVNNNYFMNTFEGLVEVITIYCVFRLSVVQSSRMSSLPRRNKRCRARNSSRKSPPMRRHSNVSRRPPASQTPW